MTNSKHISSGIVTEADLRLESYVVDCNAVW